MAKYSEYIGHQTLASKVIIVGYLPEGIGKLVEIEKGIEQSKRSNLRKKSFQCTV